MVLPQETKTTSLPSWTAESMVDATTLDRALIKALHMQADRLYADGERKLIAAFKSGAQTEAAMALFEHVRKTGEAYDSQIAEVVAPISDFGFMLYNAADKTGTTCLRTMEFVVPDELIVSKAVTSLQFNSGSDRLRKLVADQIKALKTDLDASTLRSLQIVLNRGQREGATPDQLVSDLADSIGLDSRYSTALQNYRQGLVAQKFAPRRINKQVSDYAKRLRKARASTITRTETQRVMSLAQDEAWRQAQQSLGVGGYKVWIVSDDERLCPTCAPLAGEMAMIDGSFPTGIVNPPAHPNCRCATGLRFPMSDIVPLAVSKGDLPGHPFRGNQWTKTVLHRGINLDVSPEMRSEIQRLMNPPTKIEDINQHERVGPMLLELMDKHIGAHSSGLGRHWSSKRQVAEQAQGNGLSVVVSARPRSSQIETDESYIERVSMEHETTLVDGLKSSDMKIEDVQLLWGTSYQSVWSKP